MQMTQEVKRVKRQSPTPKQRKLAKIVSENIRTHDKPKSTGELMLQAGYSATLSLKPSAVTQSQGFLKALDELGLTDEFIVSSLVSDIRAKPERRAFELSIAAKIRGMEKRADTNNGTLQNMAINNAIIVVQLPPPSDAQ
jgi:hypothetical protein